MEIRSDNAEVECELRAIERMIIKGGGFIDPNLRVVCENGYLSVEMAQPRAIGSIIIQVPAGLLIPWKALGMYVYSNDLVINPDRDLLSKDQIEIAERMIELFNLTGKLISHKKEYPWIAYQSRPEIITTLASSRSDTDFLNYRRDYLLKSGQTEFPSDFLCETFAETRVVTIPNGKGDHFMPIIDSFNHDSRAFGYQFSETASEEKSLSIKNYPLQEYGGECFVSYGSHDAIDSFLTFGFATDPIPFVRSVPLEIDIDDLGKLKILSIPGFFMKENIHPQLRDIGEHVPSGQPDEGGNAILSHLLIPSANQPDALRRILTVVIKRLAEDKYSDQRISTEVEKAEQKLLEANIEFHEKLKQDLSILAGPELPIDRKVFNLIDQQLDLLYQYEPAA